tara:strand:+ start:490 stop:1392 length:903 start_codon:yes stop_codon:yes gene_type:complete
MSLKKRTNRINFITKKWRLKKLHPLITSYKIEDDFFAEFKFNLKLYISKALRIKFENNDKLFIKNIDKARNNRTNVTPNGAIVPKREYHLEYNLVLRNWCELVKKITRHNPKLLRLFRITPNIRIKYGSELKDNLNRGLSTSLPHSDAWVEGPWGMNCFIPFIGDVKKNNLKFYEPKKNKFSDKFMKISSTYKKMQWVMDSYKPIKNFYPKIGLVNISDYAAIHNTHRQKNCGTRVSIDTTIFVGKYIPHKDRLREYTKKIPNIGLDHFVDSGQYETSKYAGKISTFSHYTSGVLKIIKF